MKNLIIHFFLIPFSASVFSQSKSEMAVYNIGLGSVFGGIGAVINKKPGEKTGTVLIKGIWQGAMGGYLIYESKNLARKISLKENWSYSWGAKFVNAAGVSIVENAALNRDFWEQWNLHFGFNRIEFHTKEKLKVKYKILPVSLILTVSTALKSKFEINKTLQRGVLLFSDVNLSENKQVSGITYGNIVLLDNNFLNDYEVFNHEMIHVLQYYDYNFINTYYKNPLDVWSKKSKDFNKINNLFYWDFHSIVLRSLYLIEGKNNSCYYDNFFENEARFYTTRPFNCNN